jgi:two-component system, NtrC family, sensor kinase
MRLLPKLTLGILAASVVPLALVGTISASLSEDALRARIEEGHAALAVEAAEGARQFLEGSISRLQVYPQLVDLETASPSVTTGVLRLAYRSDEDLALVALLDAEGKERVASVYVSDPSAAPLGDRLPVVDADRDAFLARIPLRRALDEGHAIGEVIPGPTPRVAVAVSFGERGPLVLAADVSLARLHRQLGSLTTGGGTDVVLVDTRRRVVAGGDARRHGQPLAVPADADPAGPLPASVTVAKVTPRGGDSSLAAFAPAGNTGYGVVVTQPEAAAFAHVSDLRHRTFYWLGVSVLVALVVGFGLARDVSRRIGKLSAGTVELARGKFESRLDATGQDELAELARSFNQMAGELGRASDEIRTKHDEIQSKNEEISRWNTQLEKRVEDKTRELRQAQDLMLRARSLNAMGTLGAGVAHEINNPLTGVLGGAQLLLMDIDESDPRQALVKDIETQAQRIREIVANLLRIAQKESGDELGPVDLNTVIENAVALVGQTDLMNARIELERTLGPIPAVRGNALLLQEAVIELMTNARRAMPGGGRLALSTSTPDPKVVALRISDTGRGIAPEIIDKIFDPFFTTKDNWASTGMGLTLVHKIVEEHQGTIRVESDLGQGSTFTLTFPRDRGRSHLA